MKNILYVLIIVSVFIVSFLLGIFLTPFIFGPVFYPNAPKNLGKCIQNYNESMIQKLDILETIPKNSWPSDEDKCKDWLITINDLENCTSEALKSWSGIIYPVKLMPPKAKLFFKDTLVSYSNSCF